MKSREITAVAIRIILIYLFFQLIVGIPAMMLIGFNNRITQTHPTFAVVVGVVGVIIACGLMLMLWKLSQKLILRQNVADSDQVAFKLTPVKLEKIILRCLGLYIFVTNLKPTVYDAIYICRYRFQTDLTTTYINIVFDFLLLCFGLFLIARPAQWLLAIRKVR